MALEMSHYSIQEVEEQQRRPGVRGYQATGPILADRLRGKRRQAGREGREEGGEKEGGEGRGGKEVGGWGELPRRRGGGVAGVDLLNAK